MPPLAGELSKYLELLQVKNTRDKLTVVRLQRIFALSTANRISCLTCVASDISVSVVLYQELPALCVWMTEEHSLKGISPLTIFKKKRKKRHFSLLLWVAVGGIEPPVSRFHV